jgi:uncharacterized membrane protein YphA (DoxX/SURF4 family)
MFKGETFDKIDVAITRWMAATGLKFLRISIGLIFIWFGALKYFPNLSPAEDIAINTFDILTFHLLSPNAIAIIIATWEVLIGIGLLFNLFLRATLFLLYLQMAGTFAPVFLFPSEIFTVFPYGLTLEGQYIIKNLIVVSAGIVLGTTVRGGRISVPVD